MKVKLKRSWFSPTAPEYPDKLRIMSGKRYKKGVHEIPDELKPYLPSDAVIYLDEHEAVRVDSPELTAIELDEARAVADAVEEAQERANRNRENLAKARKAKSEKRQKELEENGDDST